MLRTVDPLIPSALLTAIHRARPGSWFAITSPMLVHDRPTISVRLTVERLSAVLFPALPVSAAEPSPLLAWLADPAAEESVDAFYTVQGTARDAERRTIHMKQLAELDDSLWDSVDTVITVDSPVEFAFFICVGGGDHEAKLLSDLASRAA